MLSCHDLIPNSCVINVKYFNDFLSINIEFPVCRGSFTECKTTTTPSASFLLHWRDVG